jgi:hypothetical protein
MIKLIDILNEGIIQLTSDERDQIEALIPKIIDYIEGPQLKNTEYKEVGWINYQFADKTLGKVLVYVGDDNLQASGYFQTNDPKNPTDNVIVIQQNHYKQYFNILNKGYNALVGDKNQGIEDLRKTLKHELIHAKDPALNHHLLKEPYDTKNDEIYYKSWTEFQTMTGQFFESIVSNVDRIMSKNPSNENIRKIETALNEILNFYSGKSKTISQTTADFIQGTDERNIFQRLIRSPINSVLYTLGVNISNSLDKYVWYIGQIKKYNPEGYKEFLKDLYKTIDQSKDKINDTLNSTRKSTPTRADNVPTNITLKEMKKPLNEQFLRMQQLAGLITESEYKETFLFEEIADEEIEKAAAAALNISPDQVINHEPSEEEKKINEIGVTLAITIAGLIPPALNLVGSTANKAKQMFGLNDKEKESLAQLNKKIKEKNELIEKLDKENDPREEKERELLDQLTKQKDEQFGTKLGNMSKHAAHSLHEAYVYPIKKMLQFVAWTSEKFGKKSKLSDEKYREKIANIIYATAMVGIAGYAILSHIGHLAGIAPVATFIADGVKAGKSIADIVKGAALLI